MTNNQPERSVEEIVEEILDYKQKFGCGLMAKKRITEIIQTERQKWEEMVREAIEKEYWTEEWDGSQAEIEDLVHRLIQQIITNTGEELMRRAEGERVNHVPGAAQALETWGHNIAIDTLKKHITNVTGVE